MVNDMELKQSYKSILDMYEALHKLKKLVMTSDDKNNIEILEEAICELELLRKVIIEMKIENNDVVVDYYFTKVKKMKPSHNHKRKELDL